MIGSGRPSLPKFADNGLRVFLFERVEVELVPAIDRQRCAEIRKKKK
jgi:hypothetical protein